MLRAIGAMSNTETAETPDRAADRAKADKAADKRPQHLLQNPLPLRPLLPNRRPLPPHPQSHPLLQPNRPRLRLPPHHRLRRHPTRADRVDKADRPIRASPVERELSEA